jgi:hypothetical protein
MTRLHLKKKATSTSVVVGSVPAGGSAVVAGAECAPCGFVVAAAVEFATRSVVVAGCGGRGVCPLVDFQIPQPICPNSTTQKKPKPETAETSRS